MESNQQNQRILVKFNTYYDSVTLLAVSQRLQSMRGVEAALVAMATPLNLAVLESLEFASNVQAGSNDLLLAVRGSDVLSVENALEQAETMLRGGVKQPLNGQVAGQAAGQVTGQALPKSLGRALAENVANLALISVPGQFAAREARQALAKGLHVLLFSDNVALADEVALKQYAHKQGLLLMGPDCGTAIINGVPLAFANAVRRGSIGIVGASGTGIQEVSVQIDRLGQGISQALGTGGRDLSREVGGIMLLDGIEALRNDPDTTVLVVISKPAAPEVAAKVLTALERCGKPAVYCVLGDDVEAPSHATVRRAKTLLAAAQMAVEAAGGALEGESREDGLALKSIKGLSYGPKYVRGLFSGGTLGDEAMLILGEQLGLIYSNTPLAPEAKLGDPGKSREHTVLDLGDDYFTQGRAHPMLDCTLRRARIVQEARDPQTAVILLDVVLGYGSHPDPAEELAPAIRKAREIALNDGRKIIFVAYVCGTQRDPQDYARQVNTLQQAGAAVFASNVAAAQFAAQVAKALQGGAR